MHTGSATSNIAKLAAASYRTAYVEFGNALNIIYANSNAEKEAFDVVSKELSDSADIFKKMGKELQIVIPRRVRMKDSRCRRISFATWCFHWCTRGKR